MGAQIKEENEETNKNDLDLIEDTIGSISHWQILMVFLISLIRMHISWHQFGIIFLAPETDFYCSNRTIDKCSSNCPSYEYDTSVFTKTIISEWDLVCDKSYYVNQVLQPCIMGGIFIGSLLFGYFSDRFGRKYPMIIAAILEAITGCAAAFVPWLEAFIVLKFFSTIFVGGILLISFVMAMELIGKSYRSLTGVLFQFPYVLGQSCLGLMGYLIRDWHWFQFAICVTNLIFIIYIWVIPESPRWLLIAGRREEATKVLQKAAKFNKSCSYNISEKVLVHEKKIKANSIKTGSYLDLVKTPEMRKRTICISLVTFSFFMVHSGVVLYLGQIGGDIFLNISLTGLLNFPANIICLFAMSKLGRRNTIVTANILSGICVLLIMTVPDSSPWGVTILGILVSMFSEMCITTSYVFTGELFPTVIRGLGMGVASMAGKIGSTIVSYIVDLKNEESWLPPTILGIVAFSSAFSCWWLPETLNNKLPETIEEAEGFNNKKEKVDGHVVG